MMERGSSTRRTQIQIQYFPDLTCPDWMILLYQTLTGVIVLLLITNCFLKITRKSGHKKPSL